MKRPIRDIRVFDKSTPNGYFILASDGVARLCRFRQKEQRISRIFEFFQIALAKFVQIGNRKRLH